MSEEIKIDVLDLSLKKEDLSPVTYDQLIAHNIATGYVFYVMGKSKYILLLKAGDFINRDYLKKFEKKKDALFIYNLVDNDLIKEIKKELKVLKTNDYFSKIRSRKRIIQYSKMIFSTREDVLDDQYKKSMLNLVVAYSDTFNKINNEIIDKVKDSSLIIYNRCWILSTISVYFSLILGNVDFDLLSDVFQSSFLLDYGLIEKGISISLIEACEKEREKPGAGIKFLESKKDLHKEIEVFKNHPLYSYESIIKHSESFINYPETLSFIKNHHYDDSRNFEDESYYKRLLSWQKCIIFADRILPYKQYFYSSDDCVKTFNPIFKHIDEVTKSEIINNWNSLSLKQVI